MNNISIKKYKIIEPQTTSGIELYQDSGYLPIDKDFIFAVGRKDHIEVVEGKLCNYTDTIFNILKDNQEKEKLYLTAIDNLLKQKNFLQLLYQHSNELIDDDEFNSELESNEDIYLIKTNKVLSTLKQINNLHNVINSITHNLSHRLYEEDLVEIFSISHTSILKELQNNLSTKMIHDNE